MSNARQPIPDALRDLPRLDVREGRPVVEVRDRNLWAHDHRAADLIKELGPERVELIYMGIVQDFWETYAPDAACAAGYSGEVYSAGRSSGWAYPDDAEARHFLDYVVPDADGGCRTMTIPEADDTADDDTRDEYAEYRAHRNRFLNFARNIAGALETAEQEFVDALKAARAELEERREAAIVRGED